MNGETETVFTTRHMVSFIPWVFISDFQTNTQIHKSKKKGGGGINSSSYEVQLKPIIFLKARQSEEGN